MDSRQLTLDGRPAPPPAARLFSWLVENGQIRHHAWMRARAEGRVVGTCRCGANLHPLAPEDRAGRTDYTAACERAEDCRYELTAPGGRVMRHTALKSAQPKGVPSGPDQ